MTLSGPPRLWCDSRWSPRESTLHVVIAAAGGAGAAASTPPVPEGVSVEGELMGPSCPKVVGWQQAAVQHECSVSTR